MKNIQPHTLFTILTILALSGCALYPAVQMAGGAMSGYDAVVIADDFLPRGHVAGGARSLNSDKMLERRLRERLRMQGMIVSAHVIDANAYLVGQFPDRAFADTAVDTARTVQGLKTITCKFYPATTARQAGTDAHLLNLLVVRLGETKRLRNADLRVEVIQCNAILIGETADYEQKTAAVAIASEVGGIEDVVDYISVTPKESPAATGDKIARK
ncbi:MAG: BON domain-containing protein [Pseudodesulfovibrio sp.]|nr:BON domain-containing protein [Pseudodesulfovibrio sp.]